MSPNSTTGLLDDCVELEVFAREVKRHPRTVKRWMKKPGGLPYIPMGHQTIIHIPTAREWLLGLMKKPNPRRQPKASK
jgi:hypothetical protein